MKSMLTKEQMKKISGGYDSHTSYCVYNYNAGFPGCDGYPTTPVSYDCYDVLARCVQYAYDSCHSDPCCSSYNCGCHGGPGNCDF